MNSKARITYRFDGNSGKRVEQQPKSVSQAVPSNVVPFLQEDMKFTSEIGTWNSPFQDDSFALEKLIRETDLEHPTAEHSIPSNKPTGKPRSDTDRHDTPISELQQAPNSSSPNIANLVNRLPRVKAGRKATLLDSAAERASFDLPESKLKETTGSMQDIAIQVPLGDERRDEVVKPRGATPSTPSSSNRDTRIAQDLNALDSSGKWEDSSYAGPILEDGLDEKSVGTRQSKFKMNHSYRSPIGPSWMKVFVSVTGAIAMGTLFGYMLLNLFAAGWAGGDDAKETSGSPAGEVTGVSGGKGNVETDVNTGEGSIESSAAGAKSGKDTAVTAGEALISLQVAPASYHMIQYGVFSNREGMDNARAELHGQGWAAAALETGEDYRVYAGVANDHDTATLLGNKLTDKDLYVKKIDVPALSQLPFSGKAEEAESFFSQTEKLIRAFDVFTAEKLGATTASGTDWKDAHEKWTRALPAMEAGMKDEAGKQALHKLGQALGNAAAAAGEYGKKASDAHLWAIQTSIMEAVFIEKSWFASIDAL